MQMEKLSEEKRKWIVNQFRTGRSATQIAKIQKITRQWVYELVKMHKENGADSYKTKKAGRPKLDINPVFRERVKEIREEDDYGSEKIHFVLRKEGFSVSQRQIQRILDEEGLTEPCLKRKEGKGNMFDMSGQ